MKTLLTSATLVLVLAACGKKAPDAPKADATSAPVADTAPAATPDTAPAPAPDTAPAPVADTAAPVADTGPAPVADVANAVSDAVAVPPELDCMPVTWDAPKEGFANAAEATYYGKVFTAEATDANEQKETIFGLILEKPACLRAGSTPPSTTEIQIYSSDEAVRAEYEKHVGARMRIIGTGFEPMTAHHHRPIVVEAKSAMWVPEPDPKPHP